MHLGLEVKFVSTHREIYSKISAFSWAPCLLPSASFDTHLSVLSFPSLSLHPFLIDFNHYDGFERLAATTVWSIAPVSPRKGGNLEV